MNFSNQRQASFLIINVLKMGRLRPMMDCLTNYQPVEIVKILLQIKTVIPYVNLWHTGCYGVSTEKSGIEFSAQSGRNGK